MLRVCTSWREAGLGHPNSSAVTQPSPFRPPLFRRSRIAGGMVVLLAACALSACASDPELDSPSVLAQQADTELSARLADGSDLTVGGERLDVALLQRFYARHDFEPVWTSRPEETAKLVQVVLRAGDQGLNPDLFHARLLRHSTTLPPLDRELLLSDAFLSYADALARGAVSVERRRDDEVLAPEPIDVTTVLDDAMDSSDPGAAIEALAPTTPTYLALRDALQKARSGAAGGKLAVQRIRTIEVNLERQRWLPRSLPADRAWVNVADQRLVLYRGGQSVFLTRVVVGEDVRKNQSPEFSATIDASFFDPPWVIPADIVKAEIQPKIDRDPTYLARNHMVMLASGEAEQLPGPDAGLGLLMFDMPNKFDVYLHDTPDRYIFNRDNRRLSHGCIRVQNPREFAALLLQEPIDTVNQGVALGSTTRHALPTPVPVFVVYQTAFVDTDGTLQFRPDFYQRDAGIWQQLQKRTPAGSALTAQADSHAGDAGVPAL
jgi:L,D-transpeptidase YcbB